MRKLAGFLLAAALLTLPVRAAEPVAEHIAADGRRDAWGAHRLERTVDSSLAHQEDGALGEPLPAENSKPEPSPKPAPGSSSTASLGGRGRLRRGPDLGRLAAEPKALTE